MSATPNIHERIRNAVAKALAGVAASLNLPAGRVYCQNQYQSTTVDLPCLVVSYDVGTEQERGGNNREDYVAYPVLVGLYAAGPVNDVVDGVCCGCPNDCPMHPDRPSHEGPTLTRFRDTVRGLFLHQPLAGVDEVWDVELLFQPIVQDKVPGFEQLQTAVGVVPVAAVPRAPTWSAA